jgi:hypothetical protein
MKEKQSNNAIRVKTGAADLASPVEIDSQIKMSSSLSKGDGKELRSDMISV